MIPTKQKAITSEAGPPLDSALPDPTKRPVPNTSVSTVAGTNGRQPGLERHNSTHTDRTTDGNHLQMAALQRPRKRRRRRVLHGALDIEGVAVDAHGAFGRQEGVGVALEAVEDAAAEAVAVHTGLAIGGVVGCGAAIGVSAQALFGTDAADSHGGDDGGVERSDKTIRR
jgi:hypothetical protein